ncbi:hypothetical protein [Desnuesiella massiliensis]|uniref:hypothetical protein n=1 Tax=Desnuesiella massiliensis TaxID=1650662 RepID=UPI0006E30E3C|nr:hypothetical protein [Desnuesiella massiliensis]
MKRAIKLFIVLLILASFIACDKPQDNVKTNPDIPSSSTNDSSSPPTKLVKKTQKLPYLLTNGVNENHIETKVATDIGVFSLHLPQIYGLKDKSLESKINETIKEDVNKEITKYVPEDSSIPVTLHCANRLNANNLYSICLYDNYNPIAGFLYRLTDGKSLNLKDIFTEGTDYISLLNQTIIERIISSGLNEEDCLDRPFSTIRENQSFSISGSILYIIFDKGESGFIKRTSVEIPLYLIDDYVQVLDLYSGNERETQEFSNQMVRANNIFFISKGEVIKNASKSVWAYYPQLAGYKDLGFQNKINDIIIKAVKEAANSKEVENLPKGKNKASDQSATVQLWVTFNQYGIITIARNVYTADLSKSIDSLYSIYSFKLKNKEVLDCKELITDYLKNHKEGIDIVVDRTVSQLSPPSSSLQANNDGIDVSKVDYNFILKEGKFLFRDGYGSKPNLIISFGENKIKGINFRIEVSIPFDDVIKESPEEFFK